MADVKLSNVCNYSCLMCDPRNSSQIYSAWKKDQKHPTIQIRLQELGGDGYLDNVKTVYMDRSNYDLLQQIIKFQPKHIKLLGGEPLLDATALGILRNIPTNQKRHMSLTFVTNGSIDLLKIKNLLSEFKTVSFCVSLEGVGQVQDFVRKGSDWTYVEDNIKRFIKQFPDDLYIHHTVQAITVGHLPELLNWSQHHHLAFNLEFLDRPEFMSLSALPPALKHETLATLQSVLPRSSMISSVCQRLEQVQWEEQHTKMLIEYLDWHDPEHQWKNIFPSWIPYL